MEISANKFSVFKRSSSLMALSLKNPGRKVHREPRKVDRTPPGGSAVYSQSVIKIWKWSARYKRFHGRTEAQSSWLVGGLENCCEIVERFFQIIAQMHWCTSKSYIKMLWFKHTYLSKLVIFDMSAFSIHVNNTDVTQAACCCSLIRASPLWSD